jgi:UDP-glucose 4-epimerase
VKLIVEQPVLHHRDQRARHRSRAQAREQEEEARRDRVDVEVYGKSEDVPFREDSGSGAGPDAEAPLGVRCSKAIDEFLALAYWKERKLPVIIVRFFNTVGPRQSGQYGMVIPNFVRQALAGEPITVFGDGNSSARSRTSPTSSGRS